MSKLNDLFVKKVPRLEQLSMYDDGDRLFLAVYPDSNKQWLHQTKFGLVILGQYPKIKLSDARELNRSLQQIISANVLPEQYVMSISKPNLAMLETQTTQKIEATPRIHPQDQEPVRSTQTVCSI